MGVSVGQWVVLGHITKYQINLDLIEIIQFCLNMYDLLDTLDIFLDILLKPPQPLMGLFLLHVLTIRNVIPFHLTGTVLDQNHSLSVPCLFHYQAKSH